jgi:hypothetical protein
VVAYTGKLLIHPVPISALDDVWMRATIGPVPGQLVLLAGLIFHSIWLMIAVVTLRSRRGAGRERPSRKGHHPRTRLRAGLTRAGIAFVSGETERSRLLIRK